VRVIALPVSNAAKKAEAAGALPRSCGFAALNRREAAVMSPAALAGMGVPLLIAAAII
jgi:hypothetical protein